MIFPGSASRKLSHSVACSSASASRVACPSSWWNGIVSYAVTRLSRPKIAMNQGSPPPVIARLIERLSGRMRSAATSRMLWRYVRSSAASSASICGVSCSHSSSDIGILPACLWNELQRSSGSRRSPSTTGGPAMQRRLFRGGGRGAGHRAPLPVAAAAAFNLREGAPPIAAAPFPQRGGPLPSPALAVPAALRFHDVGEVGRVAELELNALVVVGQVLD